MGTGKKIGIAIAVVVVVVFAIGQKMLIDAHQKADEKLALVKSGAVARCGSKPVLPYGDPNYSEELQKIKDACKKVIIYENKWDVELTGMRHHQYQ